MCFFFWQRIQMMFKLRCFSLHNRVGIQTVASGQTVLHMVKEEAGWFVNLKAFAWWLCILVFSFFLFPFLIMIMQVEDWLS